MASRADGIGSIADEFLVLGWRMYRVLSSDDLLTRMVFLWKSRSPLVRARSYAGFSAATWPVSRQGIEGESADPATPVHKHGVKSLTDGSGRSSTGRTIRSVRGRFRQMNW